MDWAKKLKGKTSEDLTLALVGAVSENALWRVNYLMTHVHKNWRRQEQKANINYDDNKALYLATKKGFPSMMKVLIKNGADANEIKVRNIAFANLKEDVIQILWDSGVEKEQPYNIKKSISNENLESVKFLLKQFEYTDESINGFFKYAVDYEAFKTIEFLSKEYDIDVNLNNGYCLKQALKRNDQKIPNYLVEKGARLLFDCEERIKHSIEYDYLWKIELLFKLGLKADQQMVSLAEKYSKKTIMEFLQKSIQASESKKNAEEYPKWEKIDQQSIAYISLMGKNSGLRMHTIFNFASRRISEAYEIGDEMDVPGFPPMNFSGYEGKCMITKAEEVLKEKGGDPTPYVGGKQVDKARVFQHQKKT